MRVTDIFVRGIVRDNPVFVLLLGLCPSLAVTTGLVDAVGMGLAATFVLVCSNLIVSLARGVIPTQVRIPCFIVVIATFVTIVQMVMSAYFPDLKASLGIYLPLIVVNCIILGRAEAFASRNKVYRSVVDGLGMGAGFTLALCAIALVREVLGSWRLFGVPISGGADSYTLTLFVLAPGGFLAMGLLLALFNYLGAERQRRLALAEQGVEESPDEPVTDASGT